MHKITWQYFACACNLAKDTSCEVIRQTILDGRAALGQDRRSEPTGQPDSLLSNVRAKRNEV